MFHNVQHQFSSVQSHNYSLPPPPPVPASYTNNPNILVKAASITKQESGVMSAPILSVGSKHVIYISFVEDGPNLFAVQLKATEGILQNMTQTFAHVPLKPFSQFPIPGSACLILLPQAKVMCRAVVTNLMENECVVYCVDFGNTETVPFSLIYEMPSQFLNIKSFAMRFCLAGIQNIAFGEKAKRIFQELVTGETLTLEVIEPEGPPFKQYGNIYLNGANILHIMKEKLKDLVVEGMLCSSCIQLGRFVNVTVVHVESVDNFYVQYEANAKALAKIITMTQYCNNSAAMIQPNELYIGMPVCAFFSADQQWYRAKVLSVRADQISVFYVDYGNTDTVNLISLRQMDTNLSQAQAQAVVCCLSGYEGPIASLDRFEEISDRFEEMTLERKLTMKIVNRLSNGKFVVELQDTTVAPIVNIGQNLISPIKTYEETPIDESPSACLPRVLPKERITNCITHFRACILQASPPTSQCNLQALIYKNEFKQNKKALCDELFKIFNREVFENKLPSSLKIGWNTRMSRTAGCCYNSFIAHPEGQFRSSIIDLSTKVCSSADRVRDTLIHELCHAATWIVDGVNHQHGAEWKAWTKVAMKKFPELPPISRCHSYEIHKKYTYKCKRCGYSIGRHSKSLDLRRKRCGYCCGEFELLINTKPKKTDLDVTSVPRTPRAASGFALYVKENYKATKEKNSGLKHVEIMRLLGTQFSVVKRGSAQ